MCRGFDSLLRYDMYYAYVIRSKRGLTYIGQTQNLEQRLKEHNTRKSQWTSQDIEWKIIYTKAFETRSEAMRYEKWLKSGAGRDFLKEIIS